MLAAADPAASEVAAVSRCLALTARGLVTLYSCDGCGTSVMHTSRGALDGWLAGWQARPPGARPAAKLDQCPPCYAAAQRPDPPAEATDSGVPPTRSMMG
jgi:hypothetical protein